MKTKQTEKKCKICGKPIHLNLDGKFHDEGLSHRVIPTNLNSSTWPIYGINNVKENKKYFKSKLNQWIKENSVLGDYIYVAELKEFIETL